MWLAQENKTKKQYALKVVKTQSTKHKRKNPAHEQRMLEVLTAAKSPFTVQLVSTFEEQDFRVYVLEFVPGGELFTHVK